MSEVTTIRVKTKDGQDLVINKEDYDSKIHEKEGGKADEAKVEKEKLKVVGGDREAPAGVTGKGQNKKNG